MTERVVNPDTSLPLPPAKRPQSKPRWSPVRFSKFVAFTVLAGFILALVAFVLMTYPGWLGRPLRFEDFTVNAGTLTVWLLACALVGVLVGAVDAWL